MGTRCVKWAFVHLEPDVGRVFLGPVVASKFVGFRMFRSLYWVNPFVRRRVGKGRTVSRAIRSGVSSVCRVGDG